MPWLIAAVWIVLHAPDGQVIYLNPETVTNFRRPRGVNEGHFTQGTQCIVYTTDGKYVLVRETCESVSQRLHGLKEP